MCVSKSKTTQTTSSGVSRIAKLGLAVATMSVVIVLMQGRAQAEHPPCLSVPAVTMEHTPETVAVCYGVKAKAGDGVKAEACDEVKAKAGYGVKDGRVRLIGSSTTEITLRAAVFNTTGKRKVPWTHFSVLYKDPDGPGEIDTRKPTEPGKEPTRTNQARVHAVLKYIDQSGSPPKKVVELDSNKATADDEASLKKTRHMRVQIPEGKLNFERNYYFVEIVLTREGTDENKHYPDVLGFKLCEQFK